MKVKTVSEDTKTQSISFETKDSTNGFDPKNNRFECMSCGFIYDPDEGIKKLNIQPGTAFLDIDREKFRCPVCRVGFGGYMDIGAKSKPSGFEENLTFGF